MGERLRLLWIAESDDDTTAVESATRALSAAVDRTRVSVAESASRFEHETWDLIVCSASRALASLPRNGLPPVIAIANDFEDVALDAYRLGALVCQRDRLPVQLEAALRKVASEVEARTVTAETRAFELGQRDVLEQMASGAPLRDVLGSIVALIEKQSNDVVATVLLLDRDRGRLLHAASGRLAIEFMEAIDGVEIGPNVGSCGAAASCGERVVVEDVTTHPNWDAYRDIAVRNGLRACWSSPIFAPDQTVLGTFAIYYPTPRGPSAREIGWVDRATHLASIALVRDRAERALRHSERLESLTTLASGIAHDFNNILMAIHGNVNLVSGDVSDTSPAHESLAEIERACVRAQDLVKQVATFSGDGEAKRCALRIEPVVEEAMVQLRAALPQTIRVSARYVASLPDVFADPDQLKQIVLNLGRNAAYAMKAGGLLTLHAERVEIIDRFRIGATLLKAGTYVRLDIADTGRGMKTETLERIFDPFFTTKEPGEGTGLGLSVVHGIVKGHDGAIEVRSSPSHGSCFSVYLPAMGAPQLRASRSANAVPARGEGERILCIDDEAPVVRVTSQLLRRLGYQVTGHTDPNEALALFERDPSQYELVLTDFAMPKLSCFELVRSIQRARPELPIVVTSGRIEARDVEKLRAMGVSEVVFKPSTIAELTAGLRRALRAVKPS